MDNINWLYQMGLESIDIVADVPFDFAQDREISNNKKPSNASQKKAIIANSVASDDSCLDKSVNNTVFQHHLNSQDIADSCNTLEELRNAVVSFNGCDLKKTAIKTVFADGNISANIMLIGEAPGASEDAKGIPFCGESGILLDNIFKSIHLSRNDNLYITNSVFWRPPANRRPTNEEIEMCKPFLEKHIALIKPRLIVLVGSTAVSAILGHHFKISDVRGQFSTYQNRYLSEKIDLTAIFHPAYLLRQPSQKKDTWYDILRIKKYLES